MSRIEDSVHVRITLQQRGAAGVEWLVAELRDIAIKELGPVLANLRRPMSDENRAEYQERGISLDWNLANPDDVTQIFLLIKDLADVSRTQNSAAQLLLSCTQAQETPSLIPDLAERIADAYAGLDHEEVTLAQDYRAGQKEKSKKPRPRSNVDGLTIHQVICDLARSPEFSEYTARELWPRFHSALDEAGFEPKELTNETDPKKSAYKCVDGKDTPTTMGFGQFANLVSSYRKNPKAGDAGKSG